MCNTEYYAQLPIGTKALILSKLYYSVLSKKLENIEVERYYSILFFLMDNKGCSQQQICNNLAIDKTAMVKIIDYLVKIEYIRKNINLKNRREHFIELTKKGLNQTKLIVKSFNSLDKDLFCDLPLNKQIIFNEVICEMSFKLKNLPATDLFFEYKKTKQ
jgi:DNA-binding MarR family transcriptional regulator